MSDNIDTEALSPTEQFFYEHAGWAWDPETETSEDGRIRNARNLAAAEAARERRDWWVSVEPDPEGPMEDDVGSVEDVQAGEAVCLEVTLYRGTENGPEVLASLGNVIVPDEDDPYLRVVAAELADEALTNE